MSELFCAGPLSDFKAGFGKILNIAGKEISFFLINGEVFAIDNSCPHRGGPLSRGVLENNLAVRCPLHGWLFDLKTGDCLNQTGKKVGSYPVEIKENTVYIYLEA